MTEQELTEATGLVARVKRLEAEALQTRNAARGDQLFVEIDAKRWLLQRQYDVVLPPFTGKPGPAGRAA